ncbi:MAG: Reversal of tor2 lethality [Watsoniomyces obsoletus]|nr:MAG: Reversal of tor2 lethality [Watsoniomyces obsoletus]
MRFSSPSLIWWAACLISGSAGQGDPQLTGTWSSKSNKVFTGPGFYDPVNEKFIEPSHTGISFSFTDDGHYEEAHYRAIANPTNPSCPKGIMQFQHGTFRKETNGSLILSPFGVDGRQLLSDPCRSKVSVYTRYNQPGLYQRYEVFTDPYHGVMRLNLFMFDGSPVQPLYLAFKPPQMLPTQTMNPTTAAAPAATGSGKVKRATGELNVPLNKRALKKRKEPIDADRWWWVGLGMTALGGVGYLCF